MSTTQELLAANERYQALRSDVRAVADRLAADNEIEIAADLYALLEDFE